MRRKPLIELIREGRDVSDESDPQCSSALCDLLFRAASGVENLVPRPTHYERTSVESLSMYLGIPEGFGGPEDLMRGLLITGRVLSFPEDSRDRLVFGERSTQVLCSHFAKMASGSTNRNLSSSSSPCRICSSGSCTHCSQCNHCTSGSAECFCQLPVFRNVALVPACESFAVGMLNACGHFSGSMQLLGYSFPEKSARALASHLQHLSSLDLYNSPVTKSCLQELAPHIAVSSTLEILRLRQCGIKSAGGKLLAAALAINKSLQELHLDNNPLGDTGISHIIHAMEQRSTGSTGVLSTLSVRNCSFGEIGGLSLANIIKKGSGPKNLFMLDNSIGELALQELAQSRHMLPLQLCSEEPLNIVFVGGGGVGTKSALIIRFVQGHFVEEYDPTIEDTYRKIHTVDGIPVTLEILDTAGQEEYSAMRDPYMRTGEIFAIGYSITSRCSMDEAQTFYDQILRVKDGKDFPKVLLGGKCDLESDRQVSREDGVAFAKRINCQFFETSSRMGTNVTETFDHLVRIGLQWRHSKLCGTTPLPSYPGSPKPSVISTLTKAVSKHSNNKRTGKPEPFVALHLPCTHTAGITKTDLTDWTSQASPPEQP
ncbi:Ras1 RAS signal transduction GTPase [Pelomyxa schiedti]|nr:Ras1 RAS signal transduction GTPase [Pelomyxa schiedti]